MPRSVAEIEADIAKVKAEMALRDKYERGFNQPQTKVGWGSYIVSGDRGMLDQYQNRENLWKNMQEQQAYQSAERALQQKFQDEQAIKNRQFQAEQAVENRQLQKELAELNRRIADEDKMDEYMRMRSKAQTSLNYAKQRLDATPKENKADYEAAQRDLALAQHDLDYYNKKVGYKEEEEKEKPKAEAPKEETEAPEEGTRDESKSVPVKLVDSKAIKRFKTKADKAAHKKKLMALDPNGQNKEVQEEIVRTDSLPTDEEREAKLAADDKEFTQMSQIDQDIFIDEHPEYKIKNGHLAYKDKK